MSDEQERKGLADVRWGPKCKTPWWDMPAAACAVICIAWAAIFLAIPAVAWAAHAMFRLWALWGMFP